MVRRPITRSYDWQFPGAERRSGLFFGQFRLITYGRGVTPTGFPCCTAVSSSALTKAWPHFFLPYLGDILVQTQVGRKGRQPMPVPVNTFISAYLQALQEGNAALFAGAGLSIPSGLADWRRLLAGLALDLGLAPDQETDLLALAQYYENARGRGRLNQVLLNEFGRKATETEAHRLLAALPIQVIWTTNYDKLIENAFLHGGRTIDVKIHPEDLALSLPGRDAVIYKMHGDLTALNEAVLTKTDFERFNESRRLFTTVLQSDLAAKTFLFIGFSFNDPNLDLIFAGMKSMLGKSLRTHYCLMRQVQRSDFETDQAYHHASTLLELKVANLALYGVQVAFLESYDQIAELLERLQLLLRRSTVFLSGAAAEYAGWEEERAVDLGRTIGKALAAHGFRVATGYGLRVGDSLVRGLLEEASRLRISSGKVLELGCLPEPSAGPSAWNKFRTEMLRISGCTIFLFGNKIGPTGRLEDASGMFDEFEIGSRQSVVPIPVGATGSVAAKLWHKVMDNFDVYVKNESLRPYYADLGDPRLSNAELLDRILRILTLLRTP